MSDEERLVRIAINKAMLEITAGSVMHPLDMCDIAQQEVERLRRLYTDKNGDDRNQAIEVPMIVAKVREGRA